MSKKNETWNVAYFSIGNMCWFLFDLKTKHNNLLRTLTRE